MKPKEISKFTEQKQAFRQKLQVELTRLRAIKQSTPELIQKIELIQKRLQLIDSYRELTGVRLDNLERIFKHYCTHLLKAGRRINFDRIGYENHHLIIQRFFAMIMDFQLNEVVEKGEKRTIVDRNELILLFKKCSSNARELQFLQFVTCVQRLFVLLYDGMGSYERRRELAKQEKEKRMIQARRREKYKLQKAKAKQLGLINVTAKDINATVVAEMAQELKQKHENDGMVSDLMKNFQIVNPTDEIAKASSLLKGDVNSVDVSSEDVTLLELTNEQKIEYFMQKIGIDDVKQIDRKIRYFQKANFRFTEVEELEKIKGGQQQVDKVRIKPVQSFVSKEITETHEQWDQQKQLKQQRNIKRLLSLRQELSHRELQKNKQLHARSLSKQSYEQKKSRINQSFERRQKKFMPPLALERVTKRKEQEETVYYNLEMVHKSTPNQLPFGKVSPERFISRDSSDFLFMEEYSREGDASASWRGFSEGVRVKPQVVEGVKRRAVQMQRLQNVNRYGNNVEKQRRYLQKYLSKM